MSFPKTRDILLQFKVPHLISLLFVFLFLRFLLETRHLHLRRERPFYLRPLYLLSRHILSMSSTFSFTHLQIYCMFHKPFTKCNILYISIFPRAFTVPAVLSFFRRLFVSSFMTFLWADRECPRSKYWTPFFLRGLSFALRSCLEGRATEQRKQNVDLYLAARVAS